MPGPLPVELRERVVEAVDNGEGTMEEIAARFRVKSVTIYQWLRLRAQTGSLMPRAMGGARRQKRSVDEAGEAWVARMLDSQPALSLKQLMALYQDEFGAQIGRESMRRAAHRLGYTFKKGLSDRSQPGGQTWSRSGRRSTR